MPRQRATSPTIYSELVKWDLTIWCFHEYVLICFRCFRRIRSNTVILVLHIPLGTGTMVRLVSLVAQVCKLLFFPRLYCILINTQKKPESSFLELSDFFNIMMFLGTHIEPVGTHFEPPSLSPWSLPRFVKFAHSWENIVWLVAAFFGIFSCRLSCKYKRCLDTCIDAR